MANATGIPNMGTNNMTPGYSNMNSMNGFMNPSAQSGMDALTQAYSGIQQYAGVCFLVIYNGSPLLFLYTFIQLFYTLLQSREFDLHTYLILHCLLIAILKWTILYII